MSQEADLLAGSLAEVFHFCKDAEWKDLDTDQYALCYHFLNTIMEHYIESVCITNFSKSFKSNLFHFQWSIFRLNKNMEGVLTYLGLGIAQL